MTTEKEFWEFAGRYFRTLTSIKDTIDELRVGVGLSKDVRAIKAMKRVENIMKDFDEQKPQDISIDECCVGCAGPCKVGDVSANLQKELDATRGMYFAGQEYIAKQNAEIRRRDAELHDLKMYQPDNFWAVVTEKDSMIRRQGKIIEEFKTIETRETDRLHKLIDDLEAELSARKEDSAVLMEVVDVITDYEIQNSKIPCMIYKLVETYIDAPEEPPETPIDEDQDIAIVFTFGEIL